MRLGLNWYNNTAPEPTSSDGRHIQYLAGEKVENLFRPCNPELFDKLHGLVHSGRRSIEFLECTGLVPKETIFHSIPLPYGTDRRTRQVQRQAWFENSLTVLKPAKAVFLDPDNGIQSPNPRNPLDSQLKYALTDEIRSYYEHFKFVIVYNHRNRLKDEIYRRRFEDLRNFLGSTANLRVLRFKRVSVRDYLFFFETAHRDLVAELFHHMALAPFNFLFDELTLI